jgi:hypothetical protein
MKVLNVELNQLDLVINAWCPVKFASIQVFCNCVAGNSGVMRMSTWMLQVVLLTDGDAVFVLCWSFLFLTFCWF